MRLVGGRGAPGNAEGRARARRFLRGRTPRPHPFGEGVSDPRAACPAAEARILPVPWPFPALAVAAVAAFAPAAAAPAPRDDAFAVRVAETDFPVLLFTFDPPVAAVRAGGVVRWENTGVLFHTVTWTEGTTGDRFHAELGEWGVCADADGAIVACAFEHAFREPGVVAYRCLPHATLMQGVVVVAA